MNEGRWYSNDHKKIVDDWRIYGEPTFYWGILEVIPVETYSKKFYERLSFWVDKLKPSYNEFRGISKICGIYVIRNKVTGDCYVGASVNVHKRIVEHFDSLKNGTHSSKPLLRSYQEHGETNFDWEILQSCEKEERFLLEKIWAHRLKASFNGLIPVKKQNIISWQRRSVQ